LTDGQLLERFLSEGAEESFSELLRRHAGMVQAVAARRLGDAALAEDAAQAVFMTLVRKARSLRREGSLAGWLLRSTELVCRNVLRERASRERREKEAGMKLAEDRPIAAGEELAELEPAVAELPARYRQALALRYYQGLSVAEVAAHLGCPQRTAETRLARGLERLRTRLSRKREVSVALLAGLLGARSAPAASEVLVASIRGACLGTAAPSTAAVVMMEGLMKMMLLARIKFVAVAAGAVAVLAIGVPAAIQLAGASEAKSKPRIETKTKPKAKPATGKPAEAKAKAPKKKAARKAMPGFIGHWSTGVELRKLLHLHVLEPAQIVTMDDEAAIWRLKFNAFEARIGAHNTHKVNVKLGREMQEAKWKGIWAEWDVLTDKQKKIAQEIKSTAWTITKRMERRPYYRKVVARQRKIRDEYVALIENKVPKDDPHMVAVRQRIKKVGAELRAAGNKMVAERIEEIEKAVKAILKQHDYAREADRRS
jgi:RNA polymerase sigma factor (sigma-70 family)